MVLAWRMSFEDYNTEKEAWLINNDGYEEHLASEPPNEEDYTGNGARGRFNAAVIRDKKKGKEIWAAAIGGFTGDARKTALTAPKHNARAMFAAVDEAHGGQTDKQMTTFTTDFTEREVNRPQSYHLTD